MIPPTQSVVQVDKIREEINNSSYPELVNNPYIQTQLQVFFGEKMSKTAIKDRIDTFKNNYLILISDKKVMKNIEHADKFTVIQSLINLTKDNLSINPHDKESCIVTYNGMAVGMPMWRGKLKRMQEKGIIRYLDYLETVYNTDEMTPRGNGIYKHVPNRKRPYNDHIVGVLLIAVMTDGRARYKYVSTKDIEKRRAESKMPEVWTKWEDEMYKKTTIGIFENEIGVRSLSYSENFDDEIDIEPEPEQEGDEPLQYAQIVTDDTQQKEAPEKPIKVQQSQILRQKIDSIKGMLGKEDRDRLESKLDSMTDDDLAKSITAIEKRIKEDEESAKNKSKNESPI